MPTDDVAAAAERLKRDWYFIYGCTAEGLSRQLTDDIETLADAYLRERDGTAFDTQWLESVGAPLGYLAVDTANGRMALTLDLGTAGTRTYTTRGEILTLLRGITLKDPA